VGRCGHNASDSGQEPVAGFCESSGSTNGWEFLD